MRLCLIIRVEARMTSQVRKAVTPILFENILAAHGINTSSLLLYQCPHLRPLLWAAKPNMLSEKKYVFGIDREFVIGARRDTSSISHATLTLLIIVNTRSNAPIREQVLDLSHKLVAS